MKTKPFLLFIVLVILSACQAQEQDRQSVTSFTFTDQNGDSFHSEQLDGKPWIASFMFTNCKTVCPPMTSELASLQKLLKEEEIEINIVSFSVDPYVDSPERIKTFLQNYTEDESNWHFLTGYSQERIEEFARDYFQTIVQKPTHSNQVIHGTNFFLVNEDGEVVGEYSYIDESYQEELLAVLRK